jgi:DNA-binding response OmpR family regulator
MPGGDAVVSATKIMVVEDDETLVEVVSRYLAREGFEVTSVGDGRDALDAALSDPPDLMILDIMLPGMDGLEVCRRLRAKVATPIVMLTALGEENDRVMGLNLGADDYVTKPFSPRELIARVKSVLRRAQGPLSAASDELRTPLRAKHLEIDLQAHEARIDDFPLVLTSREFELLVHLMLHPRQVFSREDLLEHVWGYSIGDVSTVTVHVRRLREKVERDPSNPELIQTVWGLGYRFEP